MTEKTNDIGTMESICEKIRDSRQSSIKVKLIFCKGGGCAGLKWLTNDFGSEWLMGCSDPACMQSFNAYINAARMGVPESKVTELIEEEEGED